MSYVDSVLAPGEQVVYQGRMHWGVYIMPCVWTFLGGLLYAYTPGVDLFRWIGVFISLFGLFTLAGAAIEAASLELAVTSRRIIGRKGILSKTAVELMLSKLEGVTIQQGLFGMIFGYGDVAFSGTGNRIMTFVGIDQPKEFKRAVDHAAIALGK